MLGICPNCKIELSSPVFKDKKISEMLLILKYREMIESNNPPKSIEELGYCELCNTRLVDVHEKVI